GAQQLVQGRDGSAEQAAGDDEVDEREVCGDVEGQAVQGYAPAHAHADGAELRQRTRPRRVLGPDADGAVVLPRRNAQFAQRLDDGPFQRADVSPDAEPVVVESDDRVDDELAGPVEGDVAAAVGRDDFD